jgi:hypothetical protein
MAQRQMRSDDTDKWLEGYGKATQGALSTSGNVSDSLTAAGCTGTVSTKSLSATGSFSAGQLLLIIQWTGSGFGAWELGFVQSYVAGTITLKYNLMNTYVSGAQVVVMKEYSTVAINAGHTVTFSSYDGTKGGVYAIFAKQSINIAGAISVAGSDGVGGVTSGGAGGMRGGDSASNNQGDPAQYADGSSGNKATSSNGNANGTGGGGGKGGSSSVAHDGAGGGGGNATSGAVGDGNGAAYNGSGGSTGGNAGLTLMIPGGGGGGGSNRSDSSARESSGAGGGGVVILISPSITVNSSTGSINANGGNEAPSDGAGGAGAGGSVLLKGQVISLGTTKVTATGGTETSSGGAGGTGRIHADYMTSISGTTNPTIDSRQDTSLVDVNYGAGLFPAFM